jgi:uncharacterized protein (DUF111 family)
LTTPTGAAILAVMADSFGPLPAMTVRRIGCGAGQRELEEQPNLLRLLLGETADVPVADRVWILETNLDDIAGEIVGHTTARLLEAGALDAYTTPIQMKKNRPAVKLTVLCSADRIDELEAILFSETTTLGIRRWAAERHVLRRGAHTVQTPWGPVEGKLAWSVDGRVRFSPEFESCRRIAAERGLPLREIYEAAHRAFDPQAVAAPGANP